VSLDPSVGLVYPFFGIRIDVSGGWTLKAG